ncbi:protein-tyrosine phosphatase family protein [Ferrimonas marina]|nr:dual specificity protein phosphatase family protein [Ferrimonas marina]
MQDLFWLTPGQIAGRSGPNKLPWTVAELKQQGIDTVLSLNDAVEVDASALAQHGISHLHVELPANIPPAPGDQAQCLHRLPQALAQVSAALSQGDSVLIHCRSGKDRTGLMMAYLLMVRQGFSPQAAMAKVREVRPIAFSAEGWWELAEQVLHQLRPSH